MKHRRNQQYHNAKVRRRVKELETKLAIITKAAENALFPLCAFDLYDKTPVELGVFVPERVSNNVYVKPLRDALVAIGALEDKLPPVEDYNPFDDEAPDFAALRQMDLSNGLISSNLGVR